MYSALWFLTSVLYCTVRKPAYLPQYSSSPIERHPAFALRQGTHQQLIVDLRYCHTCKVYKPLRAVHCRACNRCVLGLDHHCLWLGVCIGQSNYTQFARLVIALVCSSSTALVCLAVQASSPTRQHRVSAIVLEIIVGVFWALLVYLLAFHIFLKTRHMTTHEHIKSTLHDLPVNPFHAKHFTRQPRKLN